MVKGITESPAWNLFWAIMTLTIVLMVVEWILDA